MYCVLGYAYWMLISLEIILDTPTPIFYYNRYLFPLSERYLILMAGRRPLNERVGKYTHSLEGKGVIASPIS